MSNNSCQKLSITGLFVAKERNLEIFSEFSADIIDFVEFFPCEKFDFDFKRFAAMNKSLADFARSAADVSVSSSLAIYRLAQSEASFYGIGTEIEDRSHDA